MSDDSTSFDPFAGPAILATAPSTEPQREVWTACQLGDDASLAFNESITIRLRGVVDVGLLRRALGELVGRHEALRTTLSGDGLTLLVGAPFEVQVQEHDFRGAGETALARVVEEEVGIPFDLQKGPLFRVHFARLSEEELALVFTAHHIVCDGWSTAVLVRDWAQIYNALLTNVAPNLPAPDSLISYAKERAESARETQERNQAYWLGQFSGELPVLDLPTDRVRPQRKTFAARRLDCILERELITSVRRAGAKARASLFATLLAAFDALVFRLSGQEDLVIGIPAAGQASHGRTELVGHCVNMLPLRTQLRSDEPFSALLERVRRGLLDAQEHQDFTFGTLLTKLPIVRDPGRLPLVSVIFNVDRGMTSEAIGFASLQAALAANPRSHENFDLFLNAVEIDGRVDLECQYNTDLFDASTIQRWLDGFRSLLSDVAANIDSEVGALRIVSEAEQAVLREWNRTDVAYARDKCLHELVADSAARAPDAIACEFGDQSVTYAELIRRAEQLADELRAVGAEPGALVGICLERGIDLLIALLAVLTAGAGYVPLDPGYPRDRLQYMVTDSAMPLLITSRALEAELQLDVRTVICVDRDANPRVADELPRVARRVTPESVAYVIYTSGSTGKPKGVLVPHRAVTNLVLSVAKQPGMTQRDVVLAITTLSFDIAVSEIWVPLVVGAKIVLASREIAADGALLRDLCERSKVTFIDATPATYRLLLAAGWRGNSELTLVCTGEAMPKDLALELPRRGKAVWNGYGPTETTVWSTFWQVPPDARRVLIGRPLDNTRIYVLDGRGQVVPIGVSGELHIAGVGVSNGYLNRPELTKERFVPDAFGAAGEVMYRTGDVGRYLASGELECLGRNDNQVKLRGYRIELGEIEDALSKATGLSAAAVALREDRPGDLRLVGYVVPEDDAASIDATMLRQHLQRTLPDYMVPSAFVPLTKLPLTHSGKIDRRALPAPDGLSISARQEFVAPRNDMERLLAELWANALGVDRVSVQDDFFALGGHSLLASQVLARLRRDHGIELSFRRFFEAPSVARLAELAAGVPIAGPSDAPGIERREAGATVPLSLIQERLWLLEEMHPAQAVVHNLPAAWRLRGGVDAQILQASLNFIAQRHETLRMTVAVESGRAVQRFAEHVDLPITRVDLRTFPEAEREARMFVQIRELSAVPFDLALGPLFRSVLFQLAEHDYFYFTLRHNIIWDGWSFDIFLNELCITYDALLESRVPALKTLPVAYGDYVLWQRKWINGGELRRQVAWWQEQLAGSPPDLFLPRDKPRPQQQTYAGANLSISVSRADADALTAIAHRAGTTLFTLLFAAYTVLLQRFTGQDEVLVGTPVRARNLPEVEDLIGPFINAVVLRSRLEPGQTFLDYLAKARDLTLDAFSHQDMPLELLGARPPVVRAFFSFQDARSRPSQLGPVPLAQVDVEPPAAANDIMLWMMERPHELTAVANFSTEIFEPASIERLLRSFVTLLSSIQREPARPLAELGLLSAQDVESVSRFIHPREQQQRSLRELLELRAESAGPLTAYVQGSEHLDFSELLQRSQGVHRKLVASGLRRGDTVLIAAARSSDLAVHVLGALLADARVATLDPTLPEPYAGAVSAALEPHVRIGGRGGEPLTIEVVGSAKPPSPSGAGWLRCRFDAHGNALVTERELADLMVEVASLADALELKREDVVGLSAAPWSDSLARELLLPVVAGTTARFADAAAPPFEALAELMDERTVAVVFACEAAWLELCALEGAFTRRVTAVVTSTLGKSLEERLATQAERVFVLRSLLDQDVAFLRRVKSPGQPALLGTPLAAEARVISAAADNVPLGVVGDLQLRHGEVVRSSGARARVCADGGIELLTQTDAIELGDFGFFPTQIVAELQQHPAVRQAFVRAEQAESGAAILVAYFVAEAGVPFTETELRRRVRSALPEPMVPRRFVELASLPLDAGGAVDVSGLPSPFAAGQLEFVAPRTPNERLLAELFCDALGLERVSVYDNFFDLGGHSLLCFRVLERLEQRIKVRLSPRILLLNSLEQAAAHLQPLASATEAAAPRGEADPGLKGKVLRKLQGFWRG